MDLLSGVTGDAGNPSNGINGVYSPGRIMNENNTRSSLHATTMTTTNDSVDVIQSPLGCQNGASNSSLSGVMNGVGDNSPVGQLDDQLGSVIPPRSGSVKLRLAGCKKELLHSPAGFYSKTAGEGPHETKPVVFKNIHTGVINTHAFGELLF